MTTKTKLKMYIPSGKLLFKTWSIDLRRFDSVSCFSRPTLTFFNGNRNIFVFVLNNECLNTLFRFSFLYVLIKINLKNNLIHKLISFILNNVLNIIISIHDCTCHFFYLIATKLFKKN